MDADEQNVCNYLKNYPGQFISMSEINRRACGKNRHREDPHWAVPVVVRLVDRRILESDSTGHYRLKLPDKKKAKRWISPQIRKILARSNKKEIVYVLDESGERVAEKEQDQSGAGEEERDKPTKPPAE